MPRQAGAFHVAAPSFGHAPRLWLPGGVRVHLAPDALFFLSLTAPRPLLATFQGRLGAGGEAGPTFHVPNVPRPAGLRSFAGVAAFQDGTSLRASEPLGFTIRP